MFFWNRVRSTIKCVILVGVFVLGTGLAALHGRQDDPGQSAGKDKDKEDSGGWSLRATHLDKVAAKAFVVALAPGGKTLAIGGADNSVRLWDVATGKDLGVLLKGHPDPVEALAFAPDGKRLAIGCGATAIVWDLSAGDIEKIVRTPREGTNQINGSREVITTMAFAPDGKVLAIGADATLNWLHLAVLSGKDKEIRQHVSDDFSSVYHEGPALVKSVAYCPKTNLIAVVGYNQDAVRNRGGFNATALVDPATNAKADGAALPDHEAALECADFAPDGKRLAVGTADKLVIVYDLDKRTVSKTLKGHEGSVRAVAYSPDGKLLASAGGDRSIRIWDAVKGEPVATLTGHKHSVLQLQFAAHGNTLTSVDASGAVNVWDRKGK